MSNQIFRFLVGNAIETPLRRVWESEPGTGKRVRLARHDGERFALESGTLTFPQAGGLTYADLLAFWRAHNGTIDTWLYRPRYVENRQVIDDITVGVATDTFDLTSKYVDPLLDGSDFAYITATLDGVPQSGFSLLNNYTAPQIQFTGSGLNAVITYDKLYRVQFDQDNVAPTFRAPGSTPEAPGTKVVQIAVSEQTPGDSFVA